MKKILRLAVFFALMVAAPAFACDERPWYADDNDERFNRDHPQYEWNSGYNHWGYYNPFNDRSFEPRGRYERRWYGSGSPSHSYRQPTNRLRQPRYGR